MTDADLERQVTIRGEPHTVHLALCRSVAHTAYHVGQVVLLARILTEGEWQSLTIPRGQSQVFNQRMMGDKKPQ
jgi:hypothetical protein